MTKYDEAFKDPNLPSALTKYKILQSLAPQTLVLYGLPFSQLLKHYVTKLL